MNEEKLKKIETFLVSLKREKGEETYPFTVICNKCGSNNVTIFHGCNDYCYSSYTYGFDESCGLKCKSCGHANRIYVSSDEQDIQTD
jgi:lysyl-tRNA synthetase class I